MSHTGNLILYRPLNQIRYFIPPPSLPLSFPPAAATWATDFHPGPISLGSSFHSRFCFIRDYNPREYEIELGKWERGEKESNQGCAMKLAASKFKWLYDPEGCLLSSHINSFPGFSTSEQKGYGWFPTDSLYWVSPSSFCVSCQQLTTVLVSGVLPESQYEVIATRSYVLSPRGSPQSVGWPFASIHTLGCSMGLKLVFYLSQILV